MQRPWLAASWFLLVFAATFVVRFPVEDVVQARLDQLDRQTGLELTWHDAHWALWHSVLRGVTVTDGTGATLLGLDTVDLAPRPGTLVVVGRAGWGSLTARLSSAEVDLEVTGLPLPPQDKLEGGRLTARLKYRQPAAHLEVPSFELHGTAKLPPFYNGPLTARGDADWRGASGRVNLELTGRGLRGKGSLDLDDAAGTVPGLKFSGPLEVELAGQDWRLQVQGQPGNWTLVPAGTPRGK